MSNYFKHKMRGKSPATIAAMVIFGIIAITGLAILLGFVIMWLWNWLMPMIFGLPELTYWQAVGVFILAKLIFGGFGGSGSSSRKGSDECGPRHKKKKHDFSKWEFYDKFWEEEGSQAYDDYVRRQNGEDIGDDSLPEQNTNDPHEEK